MAGDPRPTTKRSLAGKIRAGGQGKWEVLSGLLLNVLSFPFHNVPGLTAVLSAAGVPWCQSGWDQDQGRCYLFSRANQTWEAARNSCLAQNADLVVINDQTEQVRALGPTPPWGVMNPGTEWVTGTKRPSQATEWYLQGCKNGDENCAHLLNNGLWNDGPCSFTYRWICERAATV
uniref:C-type lectin domain-containing protein n=1 Tax=Gopherus agassizii TaxID=38772 RepID=A0A452H2U0_9SAUR